MANETTPPATKEFRVWADCIRRVYQHVDAKSAEQAHRIARLNPDGWELCVENGPDCYRLSNEVQHVETGEYTAIDGISHCKSCGSEIVETVNDGAFRDGECGGCEYERYQSQPGILGAARWLYDLIAELREGGCDLFDDLRPLLEKCHAILARCEEHFPEKHDGNAA